MPQWYEPLFALLAEQPPGSTTLTLTFDELEALAAGPLPPSAFLRSYWRNRSPKSMGARLRAAGWWVTQLQPGDSAPTITFARLPPDTIA